MKIFKNLGMLCLSVWLIATGLMQLFHFRFPEQTTVMAILAVAAGVLLLFGR
jgi:hypothetical protein